MKKLKSILTILLLSFGIGTFAQNNIGFERYKTEYWKHFKVGLGWGFTETDQKPLYILDGFGGWAGPGAMPIGLIPRTINIEKRWDPGFRVNVGLSFSRYIQRSVTKYTIQTTETQQTGGSVTVTNDSTNASFEVLETKTTTKNNTVRTVSYGGKERYIGLDVNFLYNFRAFKFKSLLRNTWTLKNLHKEKLYFDGYFLGGLGLYNPISIPTINTGVGGDFWITYQWGVNFQTMAKWSFNENYRFHMHHSFGVVYRLDQGNDAGALNTLRRNQARRRKRNKGLKPKKAVLPDKKEPSQQDEDFDDFTE